MDDLDTNARDQRLYYKQAWNNCKLYNVKNVIFARITALQHLLFDLPPVTEFRGNRNNFVSIYV